MKTVGLKQMLFLDNAIYYNKTEFNIFEQNFYILK